MDAKARDKALERARSLEKAGQGDAAAKLGLTLEAAPTLDEVLAPRLARIAGPARVDGRL